MQVFGERLAFAREVRGLTQAQLAERMEQHESLIGQYESMYRLPGYKNIIELCHALRISSDWLLGLSTEGGPADGIRERLKRDAERPEVRAAIGPKTRWT